MEGKRREGKSGISPTVHSLHAVHPHPRKDRDLSLLWQIEGITRGMKGALRFSNRSCNYTLLRLWKHFQFHSQRSTPRWCSISNLGSGRRRERRSLFYNNVTIGSFQSPHPPSIWHYCPLTRSKSIFKTCAVSVSQSESSFGGG